MNKRNNWIEVLRIANEDLHNRNGRHINVKKEDDGFYTILIDGEQFAENYLEDELEGCIDDAHAKAKKKPRKTLEEMLSNHAYNEIIEKLKNEVGEDAFEFLFPAVKEALEKGSVKAKEDILIGWLDVDSMRVCSHCGAIMEEGWYLDCQGYACSDECAMKIMDVPDMDHFHRYRIYKEDIDNYLEDEGLGRKEEDLTQEEIDEIIDEVSDGMDACYTEWY